MGAAAAANPHLDVADLHADPRAPSWTTIASVLAACAAAWCAAGSVGLIGFPLMRSLTWIFMIAAVCLALGGDSREDHASGSFLVSVGSLVVAIWLTTSAVPAARVAGVALALYGTPTKHPSVRHDLARAIFVFACWVFAVRAIHTLWYVTDGVSEILGTIGGGLAGNPLSTGMSFAGIDFLVLVFAFHAFRHRHTERRTKRLVTIGAFTLAVHLVYLVVLTMAPQLRDGVGDGAEVGKGILGHASPWNLPALAALLHLALLGVVLTIPRQASPAAREDRDARSSLVFALMAALVPIWLVLPFGRSTLEGKKVVAYEKNYGNWDTPKHGDYGRLSIGMYGMLTPFIESLGGEFLISKELSDDDLRGADVLLLLFPHDPWLPGQLERIDKYVRDGGALMILGEHTTVEEDGGNRFNDILEKTGMPVAFDSAMFHVGGWLQSYDNMFHPACQGVGGDRNEFGVVTGASLDLSWPARPLVFGRWGWNDPGDKTAKDRAYMSDDKYGTGERLGDCVLIAEQEIGDGIILAFGDTSTMTNGITMGAYTFSSRLLGYLASRPSSPGTWWRQLSGLCFLVLLLLGVSRAGSTVSTLAVLLFGSSLVFANGWTADLSKILPDGRIKTPNNLAFIDGSHHGRYSDESWRENGTMGLRMTLNRMGYQCLELKEFTKERVERAGIIVSLAPQLRFTPEERKIVRDYVDAGGIFICTSSYHDRAGCEELLHDFGFEIGRVDSRPGLEPQPMGHFKAPYHPFGNDKYAHVRFHEAWPVADIASDAPPVDFARRESWTSTDANRAVGWLLGTHLRQALPAATRFTTSSELAWGRGEINIPVILRRNYGLGSFVIIADSEFAQNHNLERIDGSKFEGRRENAHFWRWLITQLRDNEAWIPPHPDKEDK